MVDDYHEAMKLLRIESTRFKYVTTSANQNFPLSKRIPIFFRVLRYEDLVKQIPKTAKDIFNFMDLDLQPVTSQFIFEATHPNKNNKKNEAHIRDPKTVATKWMEELDYTEIANIQKDCKEAMQLWGYRFIKSPKDLTDTNPVGKFVYEV